MTSQWKCEHCKRVESAEVNANTMCPAKNLRARHRMVANVKPESSFGKATGKGFAASQEQREKRKLNPFCIHCGGPATDPLHVIPRGVLGDGQEDERATVNACRDCHRLYDTGALSLLEDLETTGRAELAFAVERYGLLNTLARVTNERWAPVNSERKAA